MGYSSYAVAKGVILDAEAFRFLFARVKQKQ